MADEPDYDPVECPVADCSFRDAPRAVAAHVGGTEDDRHDWDRLPYDGARSFVMDEKRRQLEAMGADVPGVDGSKSGADAEASGVQEPAREESAVGTGDAGDAGEAESAAESEPIDASFADDAVAVLSLLRRYGTRDLADLDTFRLVNLYALLSDLESAAGDARGQVRDALLEEIQDDRSVAADFGEINRNTYEYRRLKDDETVRQALERAGVDPAEVMSLDESKVEEVVESGRLDREAAFDVEERARIRRVSVAEDRRAELLSELDPELRALLEGG